MNKKLRVFLIKIILISTVILLFVLLWQKDKLTCMVNNMQLEYAKLQVKNIDSLKILSPYKTEIQQLHLLEFGANTCKPCRKTEAILLEIDSLYQDKVEVSFYNIRQPEGIEVAKLFDIQAMPVVIILNNSAKETFRNTGLMSKEELQTKLDSVWNAEYN